MTAVTTTHAAAPAPPASRGLWLRAFVTLSRRRLALSAATPREVLVPLLTPILFALVIAPAIAKMSGATGGIDYKTFVAVGTVGLLVPLSCTFAGIGVIVDRESGARRDLVAAPVPRALLVLGNLTVALAVSGLQVAALLLATVLSGAHFDATGAGVVWFVAATILFAAGSYGMAESLAHRIRTQEEYVGATPAVALLPWFFAGSLYPISALPAGLTGVAKVFPLTHALAVMRYGLVDRRGSGLHDIWGAGDPGVQALLSLGVVAVFAVALTVLSIRVFTRAAVR
ncbi:MAG TPA: ABC transporter permease [Candidatus Dormibacteraeota bacterium]